MCKDNQIKEASGFSEAPGSRPVRVTVGTGRYDSSEIFASEITEEWEARFHVWCKCYHCPAGDGSMMQEMTMALVEMRNGDMKYIEPTKIHFENRENTRKF